MTSATVLAYCMYYTWSALQRYVSSCFQYKLFENFLTIFLPFFFKNFETVNLVSTAMALLDSALHLVQVATTL